MAALTKSSQQNESILIRLERPIQVLLNYLSKRVFIWFFSFVSYVRKVVIGTCNSIVNQDTYALDLLVFVRFPNFKTLDNY